MADYTYITHGGFARNQQQGMPKEKLLALPFSKANVYVLPDPRAVVNVLSKNLDKMKDAYYARAFAKQIIKNIFEILSQYICNCVLLYYSYVTKFL